MLNLSSFLLCFCGEIYTNTFKNDNSVDLLEKKIGLNFFPKIHLFLFKLNLGLPNTYRGTIAYFIDVGSSSEVISESDFIPIII